MNGVIIKYPSSSDYLAGDIEYKEINPGDWGEYLPLGEKQHSLYMDSMACVSFSLLNVVETQLDFFLKSGQMPFGHFKFLKENGYLDGGINFSDRFLAKQSGTTKRGNHLVKVADTARHQGFLPEKDWNYPREQRTPVFDWDDYYKEIPQALKDRAKKFLDYFEIQYEWVSLSYAQTSIDELKRHLKQAPLQLAAPTCPRNGDEPIKDCGRKTANHATTIYRIEDYVYQFDHYSPFIKRLELDYYLPWVMKIVLIIKNKTMKIVGDKRNNHQFIVGDDNELHHILDTKHLEKFHAMGMVDKHSVEWKDNLDEYVLGTPIVFVM